MKEARPELYAKLVAENQLKIPKLNGDGYSFAPLDKMIKDNLWICPIHLKHQDGAFYSISKNEITLPEKSQFIDGESFYGTALHEMTHSTGTEKHLNRLKPSGGFGSEEYAKEELVAELGSALVAQRYGITKHIKEDSAAYLKSWLESLKQSPDYIKTSLMDVKRAASMITQPLDAIKSQIENNITEENKQSQLPLKELGTFDIPEWAINYLENGDSTNLTEKDILSADDFTKKNFPQGFVMNIAWDNYSEFNQYPAFGEKNENALSNRGESAFLVTKTYSVQFLDPVKRETQLPLSENPSEVKDYIETNQEIAEQDTEEEVHRGRGR